MTTPAQTLHFQSQRAGDTASAKVAAPIEGWFLHLRWEGALLAKLRLPEQACPPAGDYSWNQAHGPDLLTHLFNTGLTLSLQPAVGAGNLHPHPAGGPASSGNPGDPLPAAPPASPASPVGAEVSANPSLPQATGTAPALLHPHPEASPHGNDASSSTPAQGPQTYA